MANFVLDYSRCQNSFPRLKFKSNARIAIENCKNAPFHSVSRNHTISYMFNSLKVNIMPKPLTPTQRAIVETLLLQQKPQMTIASEASCSVHQVKRMARYLRVFGTSVPPITRARGRPPIVTVAVKEVLHLQKLTYLQDFKILIIDDVGVT